jgi:hypothetical protein
LEVLLPIGGRCSNGADSKPLTIRLFCYSKGDQQMPFAPGQTVIRETHVAGFITRAIATVNAVTDKEVNVHNTATSAGPEVFSAKDGWQVERSTGARSRIVSVPERPQDLWGERSGWLSAEQPPVREGWYEFRRAVDEAVDLAFFLDGSWLAGDSVETLAPLRLAGGEQWQGLAEDPVQSQLDEADAAADEAEVVGQADAGPPVAEPG